MSLFRKSSEHWRGRRLHILGARADDGYMAAGQLCSQCCFLALGGAAHFRMVLHCGAGGFTLQGVKTRRGMNIIIPNTYISTFKLYP